MIPVEHIADQPYQWIKEHGLMRTLVAVEADTASLNTGGVYVHVCVCVYCKVT